MENAENAANNDNDNNEAPAPPEVVTIGQMRAAVIGGKTFQSYKYEIWRLLEYAFKVENCFRLNWLTPWGRYKMALLISVMNCATGRH